MVGIPMLLEHLNTHIIEQKHRLFTLDIEFLVFLASMYSRLSQATYCLCSILPWILGHCF